MNIEKKYQEYKRIENLLIDYQMCKAYFRDMSASIAYVAELIIRDKYDLPWQRKIVHKAVSQVQGKSNALIEIPQFKYSAHVNDIISKFIRKNFEKMVYDQRNNTNYPFKFRDIVEKP